MFEKFRDNQTYHAIVDSAEQVLSKSSTNLESALPARELIKEIRKRSLVNVSDPSILNYLSHAANHDNRTKIDTGGPRGGYWFNNELDTSEGDIERDDVEQPTPREAHLYEIVKYWLEAKKGLRAKDISQLKSGKTWGNPDLVGISATDRLGLFDVEIVSAEVKLSDKDWRRFIFEAVSHKRFANRVYYIFRTGIETFKMPDEMDRYAEQYRIGIAIVPLSVCPGTI